MNHLGIGNLHQRMHTSFLGGKNEKGIPADGTARPKVWRCKMGWEAVIWLFLAFLTSFLYTPAVLICSTHTICLGLFCVDITEYLRLDNLENKFTSPNLETKVPASGGPS